ncbi:nitrogen regulation protein NR(I) [Pseudidiomarina donghaiensis]|uniref:DNA-binding transcriptional regulator NtrC n=1 Tax=Pseudidiomarina donghaiensis TaxID=519452 RepID=A0A432XIG7_9GAMM|nr:nitrogen regulation protein NR(I) [Pseudidiomarina donghaiensis]RUO48416.1 nitrogen regulation protein NR(I) [Pseudidiomarina donghaiensis]SFV24172.1 two-component system, NtrC family, nitrogen regulation response regulator GlnG [Pseudidiomarina donghaiensis]
MNDTDINENGQPVSDIWVLDDDSSIRWVLERALARANLNSRSFADAQAMYAELSKQQPKVLMTDIRMPGEDGLAVLRKLNQEFPHIAVIVMTAHSDLDSAVNAFQGGAFEYLAKPFDIDEVVHTASRALARETQTAKSEATQTATNVREIIGNAPAMQDVFRAIGRLSHSSVTVLITGASGSGKELVARALHQHSPRVNKPFIALNMAAIPADLVESELFGHEKGAFTGATQKRQGRFEQAHGGTLFLDEIGDMPLAVQTRLLRVLAEGQFYPVGSYQPVTVDVRIIAATHQNLESRVKQGDFREDLFHRLNVIRLQLPSLAERREDIPQLAQHFLQTAATELGGTPKRLTPAAEQRLVNAAWPGNVRQLENTCRWLTVMAPGQIIDVADLPKDLSPNYQNLAQANSAQWYTLLSNELKQRCEAGHTHILDDLLPSIEQLALETALAHTNGHKQNAAEVLGWGRNTLARKITEFAGNQSNSQSNNKNSED